MLIRSVVLASFLAESFAQVNSSYALLKDNRKDIKFIPLTAKEKDLTAQTMVNVFEVILH
jgi:hypothetical protein